MTGKSLHVRAVGATTMIIAIDSTVRGPALGGCRWQPYASEGKARREAEALAAAMTRKSALADLALGGGKAVVVGDPAARTHEDLLAFGEFVDSLGGTYITAEDMGTDPDAMCVIAERTHHVVGLPRARGGCGDPSPFTAEGVLLALSTALAFRGLSLRGARVAIQGVGAVGAALAKMLVDRGAMVVAADPCQASLAALPRCVEVVAPEALLYQPCDVLAPCGPAAVIDAHVAAALQCATSAGLPTARLPMLASQLSSSGAASCTCPTIWRVLAASFRSLPVSAAQATPPRAPACVRSRAGWRRCSPSRHEAVKTRQA